MAQDIAQGDGESLDAVTNILAIKDREAFKMTLQANFDKIFIHGEIKHKDVINNMKNLIMFNCNLLKRLLSLLRL